jgi:hypothetical protein
MRVEYARLGSTIRACELVGATRVRRLHAQVMRRVSAYERHLVRRHPAGDRIGPALAAQHPVVPGWVVAAETGEPGGEQAGEHPGPAPTVPGPTPAGDRVPGTTPTTSSVPRHGAASPQE